MTSEPSMFTSDISPVQTSPVHTANNSKYVNHIGDISTTNLALSDAFLVPELTLNLVCTRKLRELDYKVNFPNRGCFVHVAQTGQTIRIGRRVGHLLKLVSLNVPPRAGACHGDVISPET